MAFGVRGRIPFKSHGRFTVDFGACCYAVRMDGIVAALQGFAQGRTAFDGLCILQYMLIVSMAAADC